MITRAGRLRIEIEHEHDFGPVLVVHGEIDGYTVPALQRALARADCARPARLLVDLTGVSHIGSAGVRALLDAHASAPETLFAVIATDAGARVLRVAGLDTLIAVYPYRALALVCTAAAVAPPGN
ncbi:STAS domain-containing protein [Nocardia sp. NPDC003693]